MVLVAEVVLGDFGLGVVVVSDSAELGSSSSSLDFLSPDAGGSVVVLTDPGFPVVVGLLEVGLPGAGVVVLSAAPGLDVVVVVNGIPSSAGFGLFVAPGVVFPVAVEAGVVAFVGTVGFEDVAEFEGDTDLGVVVVAF